VYTVNRQQKLDNFASYFLSVISINPEQKMSIELNPHIKERIPEVINKVEDVLNSF